MHYDQRSRLKALKINKIIYFILAKTYLLFIDQQYYYLKGNVRLQKKLFLGQVTHVSFIVSTNTDCIIRNLAINC